MAQGSAMFDVFKMPIGIIEFKFTKNISQIKMYFEILSEP
jgi:hypothetical protein